VKESKPAGKVIVKKDSLYKPLLRKFRKAIRSLLNEAGLNEEVKLSKLDVLSKKVY